MRSPCRKVNRIAAAMCGWAVLFGLSGFASTATEYRQDQILVQTGRKTVSEELTRFHQAHRARLLHELGRGGLQIIAVPPTQTATNLVEEYRRSGLVEFAEPDYIRHTTITGPNDPKYLDGTLWGLNNYGQNGGTPHADIGAVGAWDLMTSASNIVVAVLDTGIRYTHEDLAANMWVSPTDGSHGTNSYAGGNDPNDDEGHGTLMAGVIGGLGNNGKGVVGVAWNVRLMACKCFNSAGASSDSAIVAAIDYARQNGARIISASFDSTNFGIALSNAVYRSAQDGIIFVSSCGNNAANVDVTPHYPACFGIDNIVSVAYTTRNDILGQYSNYGRTNVDLAAPGAAIYSCFFTSDTAYLGSPYLEGTSYAAAYVSGALALVLAYFPGEPYQQTITRLLNGTDPVPALAGKCATGGRLNLYHVLSQSIRLVPTTPGIPGTLQFSVISSPSRHCAVQTSTDLRTWAPILTNTTSMSGSFSFSAPGGTNSGSVLFRAVEVP
ncbi:MAG TPA: S8 family peptidase [Verrucomicrobiae bacterium]|nr:S8 family peptidase [Verrucomicrobiae bacterium]